MSNEANLLVCLLSIVLIPNLLVSCQIIFNAKNQAICYEVVNSPSNNTIWAEAGLDMNVDWVEKCGDIVAYKLLWEATRQWSDWFVTGVNDLRTLDGEKPMRMWSLFPTHYHIFIICKSDQKKMLGERC